MVKKVSDLLVEYNKVVSLHPSQFVLLVSDQYVLSEMIPKLLDHMTSNVIGSAKFFWVCYKTLRDAIKVHEEAQVRLLYFQKSWSHQVKFLNVLLDHTKFYVNSFSSISKLFTKFDYLGTILHAHEYFHVFLIKLLEECEQIPVLVDEMPTMFLLEDSFFPYHLLHKSKNY